MRKGWGILLAAVLGISAVQYGGTERNAVAAHPASGNPALRAAAASGSSANSSATPECPSFRGELLKAVREFYKDSSDELPDFPLLPSQEAQFLIVTSPDPVHTQLGLFFDRNIEALEQGAQTQGYIFDRQVLPWDFKVHAEPADFRLRDKEEACAEAREEYPGLLIFRPSKQGDRPLLVFVAGERPTGGINYLQVHHSLEIIHDIERDAPGRPPPLRILGPTFSGSLYSLEVILRKDSKLLPAHVYVHSGTVTSWDAVQQFIEARCAVEKVFSGHAVQFVTFQESDQYQFRRFLKYVHDQGYSPEEVAQLSEDETAYGSFPRKGAVKTKPDEDELKMLHLYFPREISQLRSAYQHDVYGDRGAGNSSKQTQRSTLKLDLESVANDDDSVPSYSRKQLPLSQESVLLGIGTSLQKHHPRFIVLRATDPLDQLFLSRFLRQAYPNGRIVTLGADLLFNRQEDTLLHGVLAMGAYPLITDLHKMLPEFQERSTGAHVDRIFPVSSSVGIYNAILSLLTNEGKLNGQLKSSGCTVPPAFLPSAPYEQYGWPAIGGEVGDNNRLRTPPIWLSVMGRDGYWPMALLDQANPKEPPSRLFGVEGNIEPAAFSPSAPASWSFLCGSWLILALVHLLLVWRGSSMSRSEAFAQFAPHKNLRRIILLFLAGVAIAAVLGTLANLETSLVKQLIFAAATLIFAAGFLLDLRRRSSSKAMRVHEIMFVCLSLIFLAWGVLARMQPAPWRIFLYRSIHITSGVSPVLPILLLLASVYWCVWHCLSGASLLDRRRPRLPDVQPLTSSSTIPSDISHVLPAEHGSISFTGMKDLRSVAKPFAADSRIILPLAVAGLITLLTLLIFGYKHPVQSLEGMVYDWAYFSLMCVITGVLLSNLFRLLTIWLECRRLLVDLDHLPLRRAFRNLQGFSWKPLWRPGGSAFFDSFKLISRKMESLAHLKSAFTKNLVAPAALPSLMNPEKRRQEGEKHRLARAITKTKENEYQRLTSAYQRALKDTTKLKWTTFLTIRRRKILLNWRNFLTKRGLKTLLKWAILLVKRGQRTLMVREPKSTAGLVERFKDLQQKLADVCGMALNFLQPRWREESQLIAGKNIKFEPAEDVQLAEEYVALVYSSFILNILLRIRTIIMCVSGMYIFILLSINSYPFEPQSAFRVLLVGLFVLIGGIVGLVYAQMHRDPTLSLLTDTNPGDLGRDFWIKLAGFGAVPLLSLVASQFPEVNRFLFSWLQPALEALK